jgi:CHAT domain-containing protein
VSGRKTASSYFRALPLALALAGCSRQPAPDPDSIFRQATLLRQRGDTQQALTLIERGAAPFANHPQSEWHWKFRLLKAEVLLTQGKAGDASELLQERPSTLPDSPELRARLLLDQGVAEFSLSHFPESKRLFDQSLQLAKDHPLPSLVAEIQLRRGAALARLGDAAASEADLQDSLRLARQSNDTYLEATVLGNLGFSRMTTARYDEAVSWFDQSLLLLDKLQAKVATARALNNVGYCYNRLGQPEKAIPLFERAARLAADAGDLTDRYLSLGRLGDWYQNSGDYRKALLFYQPALDAARQAHSTYWTAKWVYMLAATSIASGDLDRAEQYNRQAIELEAQLNSPVERLLPQVNTARIAEVRQQWSEAERTYRSLIQAGQKLADTEAAGIMLEAQGRLANLLARTHRDREADAEFQLALATINSTRSELIHYEYRISYLSSLVQVYRDYVDFLVAHKREADALRVAESSRARVLTEMLGGSGPAGALLYPSDYQRLARTANNILLTYWLAPVRSFLWVVTPTKTVTLQLPPAAEIETLVSAYSAAIDGLHDPLRNGSEAGQKLFQILVAPAQPLIPAGSNVAVVADGALHNLDFGTLPTPGPAPHYWIEDVTLSVVPSLDLLYRNLGRRPGPAGSLLLIGDPLPPDQQDFPRLLHATSEVNGIKQQFSQSVVRTGAEANPTAYAESQPGRFSVIHFAAHAEANYNDPLDSAIILSPRGDTYKLYAREVVGLPIHANLVTLSACRSAGSRSYAGEGLVGFAWAFLEAGAQNVIAGLWEVDDASTARLMERVYGELRRGATPQRALRTAKLAMMHSDGPYRKPYYWAPFQVITDSLGNGR